MVSSTLNGPAMFTQPRSQQPPSPILPTQRIPIVSYQIIMDQDIT